MRERRQARVGTVGGLALLTGGTAVAAVVDTAHSPLTAAALAGLAVTLAHSLLVEIRRQAHRETLGGWAVQDTVNTALLGSWAVAAMVLTFVATAPLRVRLVGGALAIGYACTCGYFGWLRRRAIRSVADSPPPANPPPRPAARRRPKSDSAA